MAKETSKCRARWWRCSPGTCYGNCSKSQKSPLPNVQFVNVDGIDKESHGIIYDPTKKFENHDQGQGLEDVDWKGEKEEIKKNI